MSLPPLRAWSDIPEFAEQLLSSAELWDLVTRFGAGVDGLHQRRRDLAAALLAGAFDDPGSTEDPAIQAGRVLAGWTLIGRHQPEPPPVTAPIGQRLAWLKEFASGRWDFRWGRERDFIPTGTEMLNPQLAESVYQLAQGWGLRTPEPVSGQYDHVIVLAGLFRANLNRPMAAAHMITAGAVTTGSVVGLGAARAMSAGELELACRTGCDARTEQAALEAGLERAFGFPASRWRPTESPSVRAASTGDGLIVRSAAAPLNPDGSRANTGDAWGWFMDMTQLVRPGEAVLSVTSPTYWIVGQLSLMAHLPPGATLTTVGADPARSLPGLEQTFRSQHYLQEIKATIDLLATLVAD